MTTDINELAIQAPPFPFDINTGNSTDYPILGSALHQLSGKDGELGLDDWLEQLFEELDIDPQDYICLADLSVDEMEYHLTAPAAARVVATFDDEVGAAARQYIQDVTASDDDEDQPVEADPVILMLMELQKLGRKLHRALEVSARWYGTGIQYEERLGGFNRSERDDPDTKINAAFTEDVTDLAWVRMLKFDAMGHRKAHKVVTEMAAIYASDLYAEAVALGLAPSLTENANSNTNPHSKHHEN